VGGVTREVRVELDPARLLALNATAADVSRQLRAVQQDAAGGRADVGGIEQSVRTIATVQERRRTGRLDIALVRRPPHPAGPGGHRVSDTVAERRSGAAAQRQAGGGF
jgi:multidrug efflux pump subunit AcrB